MADLNCQFVRPDRLLFGGPVASVILVTVSGELGVWPGHAPEICALGDGVVRLHLREEDGGGTVGVVISGGYAQINSNEIIILADHARRTDDIDSDVVHTTREEAFDELEKYPEGDHRRAYYENKIKWCNLLLKQVAETQSA